MGQAWAMDMRIARAAPPQVQAGDGADLPRHRVGPLRVRRGPDHGVYLYVKDYIYIYIYIYMYMYM